jgi:hypothetical protein
LAFLGKGISGMYFSNQSNISGNSVPQSLIAADELSSRLIQKLCNTVNAVTWDALTPRVAK